MPVPFLSPPRSSLEILLESCKWKKVGNSISSLFPVIGTKYNNHRRDEASLCVPLVISLTFTEDFGKA